MVCARSASVAIARSAAATDKTARMRPIRVF
jgi:hypothetical protein